MICCFTSPWSGSEFLTGEVLVVFLTTREQVFGEIAGARASNHHYRAVAVYLFASAKASAHSKEFFSKHPRSSVNVLEIARN